MALNYGAAPNLPAGPANPSIFGTVEFAASNVAGIANRIESLVDRLCGSVPRPENPTRLGVGSGELRVAASGLMEEGMRQAASISEATARINDALDRLDRSLP